MIDPEAAAAMNAAGKGDTRSLERLLRSPKADQARLAVQQWVLSHPTPTPSRPAAKHPIKLATGEYDYYCTEYNGVTLGWNGQVFGACHGYLDQYISGSHVGHYTTTYTRPATPSPWRARKATQAVASGR